MADPNETDRPTTAEPVVETTGTDAPVTAEPVTAEPVVADAPPALVTPEPVVVETTAQPVAVEPVTQADAPATTSAEPVVAPVAPVAPPAYQPVPPDVSAREVVYVQAPTPPKARHNRGFGALISLLGVVAFGLLYFGVGALIIGLTPGVDVETTLAQFALSAAFWVPVGAYAVISILFALIVDRASWWAHVLGSIIVAVLTYAVSLGILGLLSGVVQKTPDEAAVIFADLAVNPFLIAATLLARECALWFGLAISSRGRRVKDRNAAEYAAFEQTVAERRAEYERAHPAS